MPPSLDTGPTSDLVTQIITILTNIGIITGIIVAVLKSWQANNAARKAKETAQADQQKTSEFHSENKARIDENTKKLDELLGHVRELRKLPNLP
jgi:hypothetical protein